MKKLFFLPALFILSLPLFVQAQDYDYDDDDKTVIENTFGIGPRLGYYHGSEFDEGTFYYGLQARVRLGAVLGIEGSASYRPGTESNIVTEQFGNVAYDTKFVPLTASLMLFLPLDSVSP